MHYPRVCEAVFLKRPNRFIAQVVLNGADEIVHVPNTGRCREILQEGARVILAESSTPGRKTRFSLVAAYKGSLLVNIDSQAPNTVAAEAIRSGLIRELAGVTALRREVTYGSSRFDLALETPMGNGFVEVKGVTLEAAGVAMFPDAPTERGRKHIEELARAVSSGYRGCLLFVLQMQGMRCFTPNRGTDPAFSDALVAARQAGVEILAYDCLVTADSMTIGEPVPVCL